MNATTRLLAAPALLFATLFAAPRAAADNNNDIKEPNLKTVDHVDLSRYMGKWYVISHVPTFLEKGKVGSSDTYTLQPDGSIDVAYMFRKNTLSAPEKQWGGHAKVVDKETNARWSVCLIWPFRASYWIIDLDPNYQWAVVATDSGSSIWVLARSQTLPAPVYEAIRERLGDRGLKPENLQMVPQ